MQIIYSLDPVPNKITKSIFLAGPSLRPGQEDMISWRKKALQILEMLQYDGIVFVPERPEEDWSKFDYIQIIDWETKCLNLADNILFYLNRNIEKELLGLTTNDEWGYWKTSGKCVLCTDPLADHIRYQEKWAKDLNVPIFHDLYNSLKLIIDQQKEGSERIDGERWIPLYIWNHPSFKSWYSSLKEAGNRLEEAKVLKVWMVKDFLFAFNLWVNVWIESEKRYKNNEFIISRTDISSCLLYFPRPDILESEIVIIKEFRSPINNSSGYVYELPGGSTFKYNEDPKLVMIEELKEECNFIPKIQKLNLEENRQLAATMLTHKCHLFSYELDAYELNTIKTNLGKVFGNIEDSERTFIEVFKVKDILNNSLLDWSNIGMILSVLNKKV